MNIYAAIFYMLRPAQWVKNGFVFVPLIFGLQFGSHENWVLSFVAFAAFLCASSVVYIINDIRDRDSDRHHPEKRRRPIAAGTVPLRYAFFSIAFLLGTMIGLVLVLPKAAWLVLAVYVFQNILYTFWLKKLALIDALLVALGSVLRVLCGGLAIMVDVSPWLLVSAFMLSLFLAFAKRYQETRRLNHPESAPFGQYTLSMLDRLVTITAGSTLVTYAIYTVSLATEFKNSAILYTLIFVVYGLFRYMQHVYYTKKGGAPERLIYNDYLFIGNVVAWLVSTIWVLATLGAPAAS